MELNILLPTLLVLILIFGYNIFYLRKSILIEKDILFSVLVFTIGIFILILSLFYSNHYILGIGSCCVLSPILFIRFRDSMLYFDSYEAKANLFNFKVIDLLFWATFIFSVLYYYNSHPYTRSIVFFILLSIMAAFISLQVIFFINYDSLNIYAIFKILVLSIFIRVSGYFISPYPVGSDVWVHTGYITHFLESGSIWVPFGFQDYYLYYPISHLISVISIILSNISVSGGRFIIGLILVFSTIFVYLLVYDITSSNKIALLSLLLINIADFHIQWGIEVIPMTLGIAYFSLILFLLFSKQEEFSNKFCLIIILVSSLLVWTHTVSSFILLTGLLSSIFALLIYYFFFNKNIQFRDWPFLYYIFVIILIYGLIVFLHWFYGEYHFGSSILYGLKSSIVNDAELLGRANLVTASVVNETKLITLLKIFGFIIYVFFGIIGSLKLLSNKYLNWKVFCLLSISTVFFIIMFVFPLFNIRNIMPYRWPVFIYVIFILFVACGLIAIVNLIKSSKFKIVFVFVIISISSFFMITTFVANMDSPVYLGDTYQNRAWYESEIQLSKTLGDKYDGIFVSDEQHSAVSNKYLNGLKTQVMFINSNGSVNWNYLDSNNKLFVWRKKSLNRAIQVYQSGIGSHSNPEIVLGYGFYEKMYENYNLLFDLDSCKAFQYSEL